MTLARRLTIKTALLLLGLVLIAAVALTTVRALNQNLAAALREYQHLRGLYEVGVELVRAREMLTGDDAAGRARALPRVLAARVSLQRFETELNRRDEADADMLHVLHEITARLTTASGMLYESQDAPDAPDTPGPPDAPDVPAATGIAIIHELNAAMSTLSRASQQTRLRIERIEQQRQQQHRRLTTTLIVTAGLISLAAIGIGLWQYRAVMHPLQQLQHTVKQLTDGQLQQRVTPRGDDEFVQLANDFNAMAGQLERFYRDLEDQVRTQSKALAQAERLASVGYLAAGVAHEINNPLAIIAGQVELERRQLDRLTQTATDEAAASHYDALRQTLKQVHEEAFRCKAITDKLLTLAHPQTMRPEQVDLNKLVAEVKQLVGVLKVSEGRTLVVTPADSPVIVRAEAALLKQVLLNVLINALQATEPGIGRIEVRVLGAATEEEARARVVIRDNGCGMDEQTLARIFEPFFTTRRGRGDKLGTGLGLSISHAIMRQLGGELHAQSQGPGKGSTFTVEI